MTFLYQKSRCLIEAFSLHLKHLLLFLRTTMYEGSLYRTDCNGDIKLVSDGKSINISTAKKANLNQLLTSGFIPTPTPEPTPEPVEEEQKPIEQYYIINTNTEKFHYPTCRSIKRMKDKNKLEFTGTREDVLARGYSPCMICNP